MGVYAVRPPAQRIHRTTKIQKFSTAPAHGRAVAWLRHERIAPADCGRKQCLWVCALPARADRAQEFKNSLLRLPTEPIFMRHPVLARASSDQHVLFNPGWTLGCHVIIRSNLVTIVPYVAIIRIYSLARLIKIQSPFSPVTSNRNCD